MNNKQNYEAPTMQIVEIELEGVLCASGVSGLGGFSDGGGAF